MGSTSWSNEEDSRIDGLPWIAQLVYLRGLRRHMDYSTGIVGRTYGISRASIARTLYIEPGQGRRDYGEPSQKAITRALEVLEKTGLIEKIKSDRALIFKLPYAETDKSVSQKWGRRGADVGQTKLGRPESSDDVGCEEKQGRRGADPNPEKLGTSPVSGIRIPPNPNPKPSQTWDIPSSVDRDAWEEFEQHRRDIRKPLTDLARRKNAKVLEGIPASEQRRIVDATIANRWTGLFPSKGQQSQAETPRRSRPKL